MNSSLENLQMVTSSSSPEEEEDNLCHYAMQLVSASVLPMVLKAAIELGLLEIMERAGPGALLSPFDIASQLPTANNSPEVPIVLDRILRLLASYSILTCSLNIVNSNHDIDKSDHHHHLEVHRLYGLAPVSKYFIPNKDGASLAPLFGVMQDKVMIDMWYHTKDAVLEGEVPFNRAYGMNSFEYISKDARYLPLFKASMRDYNSMFMNKILETYKGFEGLKSLVDVGGGDGTILNMILSHYPTIKAINFDLAPIIQNSPSYPAGVEHVSGDMFLSIPKGDAIFMKWILHSWDDEHCLKLLKNCYEALPDHGKVIVVDLVVPESPESKVWVRSMLQFDLYMMNMNPGGKERTENEFGNLAKEAGFSSIKLICRAYNFSLVEFYKKL